jgi:hypothetical protein
VTLVCPLTHDFSSQMSFCGHPAVLFRNAAPSCASRAAVLLPDAHIAGERISEIHAQEGRPAVISTLGRLSARLELGALTADYTESRHRGSTWMGDTCWGPSRKLPGRRGEGSAAHAQLVPKKRCEAGSWPRQHHVHMHVALWGVMSAVIFRSQHLPGGGHVSGTSLHPAGS